MIHRGNIVEKYIRNEGKNLVKLAEQLPWTVKTIYRHFDEANLSTDKILEYSEVLKHDFSDEIPEMEAYKFQLREPNVPYKSKKEDKLTEAQYYRDKYEQLLEKYNLMLEKYNKELQKRGYDTE